MIKFIPYNDKVQIKPQKSEIYATTEDTQYLEIGEVIAVGDEVTFLKVGDTVYFDAWGMLKTPEIEGQEQFFVVPEKSQFILGKVSKNGRKK